jgi:3'-5' exoribonuclease
MICSLVPNQEVASFFLIADLPQVRKSKKGSDYMCLELVDASGKVDARLWDVPAGLDVNSLKKVIVKIKGMTSEWDGKLQISISQIRKVEESDGVNLGDFFERSERDPEEMWKELRHILATNLTEIPVVQLLSAILKENEVNFKRAPAAMKVHHAYLGGLLEHVLDMCKVAIPICENYGLSKDLVLAGCVLHDVGKCFELTYDFGIGYSIEGTLIGHIGQGMVLASEAIGKVEGFPQQMKMAIMHLIASHHGMLQYGSPKVPLMREAIALNLIDLMSSKMGICARATKVGISAEGLTEWVKELDGPLYKLPES